MQVVVNNFTRINLQAVTLVAESYADISSLFHLYVPWKIQATYYCLSWIKHCINRNVLLQGSDWVTIPGDVQETFRCCTMGHGLVKEYWWQVDGQTRWVFFQPWWSCYTVILSSKLLSYSSLTHHPWDSWEKGIIWCCWQFSAGVSFLLHFNRLVHYPECIWNIYMWIKK